MQATETKNKKVKLTGHSTAAWTIAINTSAMMTLFIGHFWYFNSHNTFCTKVADFDRFLYRRLQTAAILSCVSPFLYNLQSPANTATGPITIKYPQIGFNPGVAIMKASATINTVVDRPMSEKIIIRNCL